MNRDLETPVKEKPRVVPRRESSVKRSTRKRKRVSYKDSSSDEEPEIDKVINATVAKNNLSEDNVKDILQNLLANEKVLEVCKLRAQEINMHLDEEKQTLTDILLAETPTGSKLTRRRAKELNHPSLPDLALRKFNRDSDSDHPSSHDPFEDSGSDFEPEAENDPEEMDIFKKPNRPTKRSSNAKKTARPTPALPEPELILVDPEMEGEEDWLDFLNEMGKPINALQTEDDETDPEYVVTTETDEIDKEVKITKTELRGMWKEALDCFEETLNVAHPSNKDNLLQIPKNECSLSPKKSSYHGHSSKEKKPPIDFVSKSNIPSDLLSPRREEIVPVVYKPNPANAIVTDLPQFISPAPGVTAFLNINTIPPLQPNYNLTLGTDDKMYLVPLPTPMKSITKPKVTYLPKPNSAFLEINLEDDITTIVSQINKQRLVYQQEMEKENWEISGWTKTRLRIYHRQLLSHIQLLGQIFVLTFSHPLVWQEAKYRMAMLEDLVKQSEDPKKWVIRQMAWNLHDMVTVCKNWQAELSVESEENCNYVKELAEEVERRLYHRWAPVFPDRVIEVMISNKAFIFLDYVPVEPPIPKDHKHEKPYHTQGSLILIAMIMYHHNILPSAYRAFWKSFLIFSSKFLRPIDCTREIGNNLYQFWIRSGVREDYEKTMCSPEIFHKQLEFNSYDDVKPWADLPFSSLPIRWARYCYSVRRFRKLYYDFLDYDALKLKDKKRAKLGPKKAAIVTVDYSKFKAQFKLPAKRGRPPKPKAEKEPPNNWATTKAAKAEEIKKARERGKKILERFISKELEIRKPHPALIEIRHRKSYAAKLMQILIRWDNEYDSNMLCLDKDLNSTKLFYFIKEFDIYMRLFHHRLAQNAPRRVGRKCSSRSILQSGIVSKERLHKSLGGSVKEESSSNSLTDASSGSKDVMFAWKFLKFVETNAESNRKELFEFLKSFRPSGTLCDFYLTLEDLFLVSCPVIVAEFLNYLLPLHGPMIGEFVEQCLHKDNLVFLEQLQSYIKVRKDLLSKIYDLLNESSDKQPIQKQLENILQDHTLPIQWLTLFNFKQQVKKLIFPGNLIELVRSLEEEFNSWSRMRLQLSDDDVDDKTDTDSVIFVPNDDEDTEDGKKSATLINSDDSEDSSSGETDSESESSSG